MTLEKPGYRSNMSGYGVTEMPEAGVPALFLPIGPPACGKTTYGHKLVFRGIINEQSLVSPDELREKLADDISDQTVNKTVFKIVDIILEERFKRGLDVYLDATNLQPSNPKKVVELCRSTAPDGIEYDIVVICFDVTEGTVRERNSSRSRIVPDHAMDRMLARMSAFDLTDFCGSSQLRMIKAD